MREGMVVVVGEVVVGQNARQEEVLYEDPKLHI